MRFAKKEDAERLFEIDEKIKADPEVRAIADANSILMNKERILHIFRPVQKDQQIDPLEQKLAKEDLESELFKFYKKDVSKKRNFINLFKGLPVLQSNIETENKREA